MPANVCARACVNVFSIDLKQLYDFARYAIGSSNCDRRRISHGMRAKRGCGCGVNGPYYVKSKFMRTISRRISEFRWANISHRFRSIFSIPGAVVERPATGKKREGEREKGRKSRSFIQRKESAFILSHVLMCVRSGWTRGEERPRGEWTSLWYAWNDFIFSLLCSVLRHFIP